MQRNEPQNIGIGINIHCRALLGRPFAASLGMTTTSHRHQAHHGHVVCINIISPYHFHHRPDQSFAWKPSTAPPATVQSQNKRFSCNLCGQINPITPILQHYRLAIRPNWHRHHNKTHHNTFYHRNPPKPQAHKAAGEEFRHRLLGRPVQYRRPAFKRPHDTLHSVIEHYPDDPLQDRIAKFEIHEKFNVAAAALAVLEAPG